MQQVQYPESVQKNLRECSIQHYKYQICLYIADYVKSLQTQLLIKKYEKIKKLKNKVF